MKALLLSLTFFTTCAFAENARDRVTQIVEQCVITKSSGKNDQRNVTVKVACAPASKDTGNGGVKR